MKPPTLKKENGFTIVETLVAISILLLVIIGPMTVAQKGIQNAYFASDQVTAVFLAQEAIEAVRKLRDDNALDALEALDSGGSSVDTWAWYSALPNECTVSTGCEFDRVGGFAQGSGVLNLSSGRYTTDSSVGVISPFTRKIYINDEGGNAVSVRVDVTWTANIFGAGNNNRVLSLQTWMYDQYQIYE